jgi:hypothetical protein
MRITLVDLVATKPEIERRRSRDPLRDDSGSRFRHGLRQARDRPLSRPAPASPRFIDGATDQVVAQYVDVQFGRKYVLDANQSPFRRDQGRDRLSTPFAWAYAKQAFDQWSQDFRKRLDELSGRRAGS